jgi:hypothetical protein
VEKTLKKESLQPISQHGTVNANPDRSSLHFTADFFEAL